MACKFIEISPGQNLPSKKFEIVEVEKNNFTLKTKDSHIELLVTLEEWLKINYPVGESLFIGGDKKLMQWSISQKTPIKEYGDMMAGNIMSMVQTSAKNYLFLSDDEGC
jgi:WD40 repeat protein